MTLAAAAPRIHVQGRCCGNCARAKQYADHIECNLLPEQRASVARDGVVAADDFCDQHDFRAQPDRLVVTA